MERSDDQPAGQPPAKSIDDLLVEFRAEAERHGVHDQVMDLAERFIERAYQRGREQS